MILSKIHVSTILFFVFLLSLTIVNAQSQKDSLQAYAYIKKGDSLAKNYHFKNSSIAYKKAIPLYKQSKAWEQLVVVYNKLYQNSRMTKDLEAGKKNLEKALKISNLIPNQFNEEKSLTYLNLGVYHIIEGSPDKSIIYFFKALDIRQKIYPKVHEKISELHKEIGDCYYTLAQYNLALKHIKTSLQINKKVFGDNSLQVGNDYHRISIIYTAKGEFDPALDYAKQGLSLRLKHLPPASPYVKVSYIQLAYSYAYKGDFEKALYYNQKHYDLVTNKKQNTSLVHYYMGMSKCYHLMGAHEKALEYDIKKWEVWNSLFGEAHIYSISHLADLGKAYISVKNYEKALYHLNTALANSKKKLGKHNHNIANIYISLGELYNIKTDYRKAIEHFNKALQIFKYDGLKKTGSKFYQDVSTLSLLKALKGKAFGFLQHYKLSENPDELKTSLAIYRKTDELINTTRLSLQNYDDKVDFSKVSQEIYSEAIQANFLMYKRQKKEAFLKTSLYYSEKNKANTLHELLSAKSFSNLPKELIELENTFKNKRSYFQSKITNGRNNKDIDSLTLHFIENKLFNANRSYDSLIGLFEKKYPRYYQLKHTASVITFEAIQRKLNSETTLLEYFTADSTTYAFVISKNNFQVKELVTPNLLGKIGQMRKALEERDLPTYKTVSRSLYQTVIAPMIDHFAGERLIIVPDGPLWHLNFDLLLTEDNTSKNPKELPYLLKKYAISYANSANLLFNRQKYGNQKTLTQQVLAFSYSDTTALANGNIMPLEVLRDATEDLPGTREEIRAIAQIVDGAYYYGKEAVEANFKKDVGNYNIVHLALHGKVDNERPQNSKLYFTKTKDSLEDNFLYSHELFAMNIPAELTVLSACNTGTGKITKGEGIMSLGNAFQYAGTKSLLLSSWEVADDTAPKLMQYFYSNLKDGMDKSRALQQAKLKYLKTVRPERSHPFYWGSFYLVGDTSPLDLDPISFGYWILGSIVVLIFGAFIFNRKKQWSKKNI